MLKMKMKHNLSNLNKKVEQEIAPYKKYNEYDVIVGIPDNATNSEGQSIAEYARYNEFGTIGSNIPERPFMRDSLRLNKYKRRLKNIFLLKGVGNITLNSVRNALINLGKQQVDNIQDSILYGEFEELKPATIRRKGNARPLIDSGDMYESLTFEVIKKD